MVRKMLLLVSLLGAAGVAHAHAHLVESSPADKSRVTAPAAVDLKFSAAVKLTSLTLQQGKEAAHALTPLPDKAGTAMSVPLPQLTAGDYVIAWRAASDDGHVMSGQLTFTVDLAEKAAAPAAGHAHMGHVHHIEHMRHMNQTGTAPEEAAQPEGARQHQH